MDSRNGDGDSDQVADRVFLETTRRFAPPRLAQTDVALALQLAQVSPGKPVADLGCGYGRHLRALPFHAGSLAAAFCFYSSMFLGSDADALAALRECTRTLRPGAALVLTTDNPLRLSQSPQYHFEQDVEGLGRVVEDSRFDGTVDRVTKSLVTPGGKRLSATFCIRYYAPAALSELARDAGLVCRSAPLTETSPQLVALLEKP